jgi:hypothetical protein
MDQGLGFFIIVVLSGLCLGALFVVVNNLFREIVEDTQQAAQDSPGRTFLVGLINFLFIMVIAIALQNVAQIMGIQFLSFLGLFLLFLLVIGVVFGLSAMVELVNEKLTPGQTGWKFTAGGAIALTMACLTPYLGWFGLLPYVGFRGLGAFILSLITRLRQSDEVQSSVAE